MEEIEYNKIMPVYIKQQKPSKILADVELKPYFKDKEFVLYNGDSLLLLEQLPENYILDIDLDFFAPDLDYLNNQLKLKAIKKALPLAKIITIASSPYFIDQQLAFKFLREIFAQD
jgi:hypothetical protein